MSIHEAVNAWKEIERFRVEMKTYPIKLLNDISRWIYDEKVRRAAEEKLPPMTYIEWGSCNADNQQSKIQAIKAYRNRTGSSLLAAIQKWKQCDEEVAKKGTSNKTQLRVPDLVPGMEKWDTGYEGEHPGDK